LGSAVLAKGGRGNSNLQSNTWFTPKGGLVDAAGELL